MSHLNSAVRETASIWQGNPVAAHLLGLSPLLAVSTTLASALTLLACFAIALASGIAIDSVLRHYLTNYKNAIWRLPALIVGLSILCSCLDWLIARFLPQVHETLGIYVLLLCCNFAILLQIITLTSSNTPRLSGKVIAIKLSMDITTIVAAYALVLVPVAGIRQWLGGTLPFALSPPAAFLLLGLMIALFNLLHRQWFNTAGQQSEVLEPAPRARVTEKLQ